MGGAGFVLSPHAIAPADISCGYAYDAGTMGVGGAGCPGAACADRAQGDTSGWCYWRGHELHGLLEQMEQLIEAMHLHGQCANMAQLSHKGCCACDARIWSLHTRVANMPSERLLAPSLPPTIVTRR
jgi:hypothetical protein